MSYRFESTSRADLGVNVSQGRRLRRYQENARYEVLAAGIPGGLEGQALCIFVQDPATSEFWFWKEGDGTWLLESDPWVRVILNYNDYLK